ncbi:hypothetical protein [Streptomyces sp. NPDC046862]|uniref:hypothetical protein n=1 Tax=Streptomyces sp. NPDC046862 TaxID=3154603 RepID=UPI0034567A5D
MELRGSGAVHNDRDAGGHAASVDEAGNGAPDIGHGYQPEWRYMRLSPDPAGTLWKVIEWQPVTSGHECHLAPTGPTAEAAPNSAVLRITSLEKVDAVLRAVSRDWFGTQDLPTSLGGNFGRFVASLISMTPQAVREGIWQWQAQVELILIYRDGRRAKGVAKKANPRPQRWGFMCIFIDSPGVQRSIEVELW